MTERTLPWAGQAAQLNAETEFLKAQGPDERNCLQLPNGMQCYFYYDDDGVLTVSVHLEGDGRYAIDGNVPLTVQVGPHTVFRDISALLPTWDEMTDRDKGAALLHLWKREWEGVEYAVEHYPARYYDDPRLTDLTTEEACEHVVRVCGERDDNEMREFLGQDEYERLYHLALR